MRQINYLCQRLGTNTNDVRIVVENLMDAYGAGGWSMRDFISELEEFGVELDDAEPSEIGAVMRWGREACGAGYDEGDDDE